MRFWFALAFILCLQERCTCSDIKRTQDDVAGKNITLPSSEEISEISSVSTSASLDDHSTASTTTFAATSDEISTTSIPSHRQDSGRGGPHRLLRNRTRGMTIPNSVSSKRARQRTTTPKAEETVASPKTVDISGHDPVTTDPKLLPSTTDGLATVGETIVEKETQNASLSTRADHQAGNVTGEGVQESRPPPCSNECAALRRSNAVRHSSLLAKLVHRLSKPGAFEKGKSVFEEEAEMEVTSCPPGDIGLSCRQAEAMRGAEECYGGNCEECRTCDEMAVTEWPHCCRDNFRCCSQLALACQQCDQPALQVFCSKHFKRCS